MRTGQCPFIQWTKIHNDRTKRSANMFCLVIVLKYRDNEDIIDAMPNETFVKYQRHFRQTAVFPSVQLQWKSEDFFARHCIRRWMIVNSKLLFLLFIFLFSLIPIMQSKNIFLSGAVVAAVSVAVFALQREFFLFSIAVCHIFFKQKWSIMLQHITSISVLVKIPKWIHVSCTVRTAWPGYFKMVFLNSALKRYFASFCTYSI